MKVIQDMINLIKRIVFDFKKYRRYVNYQAKSELKAEVASSYLNWIWWILEPLCFMMIYSIVFGVLFGAREKYYEIFIFIGITMWNFFNATLKSSVKIVKRHKAIVSKVYLPKYMLILVKIYVNAFKMLISFGIVVLMMIFWRVPVSANILYAIPIVVTLVILTFGCSTFLLHYGVYVVDLANVLNIVLRMLFYLTGVFYNIKTRIGDKFGAGLGDMLCNINPVAYLISSMRSALIYAETPDWRWLLGWLAVGIVLSLLGIRKICKYENSYVKVI